MSENNSFQPMPAQVLETFVNGAQFSSAERHMATELLASRELLDAFAPSSVVKGIEIETVLNMFERKFALTQDASDLLKRRLNGV